MPILIDVMLTLPDLKGWYDRLVVVGTPENCIIYAGSFCIGGPVLTTALLAQAEAQAARSLHPLDIVARQEAQRPIR